VPPDTNPAQPELEFARNPIAGIFPNPHNDYLTMDYAVPADGDVLVVRGKAPESAGGDEPVVWPSDDEVRYYSICNNVMVNPYPVVYNDLPDGTTSYGCATDEETELDEDGYYTYVVGTEDQRAAIEAIPGATFIPTSTEHADEQHKLLFRNMMSADDFDESISQVPEESEPADAQAVMGDYYPDTTQVSLDELQSAGVAGDLG
jgi:hypothetical protein